MPDPAQDTSFIGELAHRTGVSRDTIRYYESAGVLPPAERTRGGYRCYRPCQRVRDQLSSHLQETRDRIQGLMALERRLVGALALDGDAPRQEGRCRIIESAGRESEAGSPAA